MLAEERQKRIMQELYEHQSVKIADLIERLQVTRETIRKDLYDLEKKNVIRKVHGGAVLNKANFETKYVSRKAVNEPEKRAIARKAATFVEENDIVYIDYGTTALYLTQELILLHKKLTIVTNSLAIANEVVDGSEFELIMIGGHVRRNERSTFGPIATRTMNELFVDIGFFSAGAVHPDHGYTSIHLGEAEVSRLMLSHSQKQIMMIDYSKYGTVHMNRISKTEEIEWLVTDEKADPEMLETIKTKTKNVLVATSEV
ncbi:DeoR/GlpR family DNA-binding transcription regulator [Bacillus sp. Marseille-P3800]|uniref:DeoR/GlpR family DNA-binding transcription regulator n=1 Tax=Bacillus sp. Marseille-P3800 TaxID=2014782 RepID=UPI000C0888B3|nr:DeoR/GlpR family DNA-binding transcription regulator [Bacillus sp. Marseille-P3800]